MPLHGSPYMGKVAQSYQQPRTLDGYKAHFGQSKGNREGYLEVKYVQKGEDPGDCEWERLFVVLQDGKVFWSLQRDMELQELIPLNDVLSVKTAWSLQSSSIISLNSPNGCYYLHSASEEDMKEWLFGFHTSVMDFILGVDDGMNDAIPKALNRHMLYGRSRSGDGEDDGSLVYRSEEIQSFKKGSAGVVLQHAATHSPSSSSVSSSSYRDLNVPTVDDYGNAEDRSLQAARKLREDGTSFDSDQVLGAMDAFDQQPFLDSLATSMEDNSIDRIATRDFSSLTHAIPPPSSPPFYTGPTRSPPRPRPPPLDSNVNVPMPTPSRSPVIEGNFALGGIGGRKPALSDLGLMSPRTSESTKRVTAPPVELAPSTTASSTNSSGSGGSSNGAAAKKSSAKTGSGKYVPPHLRKKEGEESKSSSNNGNGISLDAVLDDYDEGLFMMDSSRSLADRPAPQRTFSTHSFRSRGDSDSTLYGRTADQGCRSSMEDFDVAEPTLLSKPLGFYAVYDGHCGKRVAQMASEKLHLYSVEEGTLFSDWPNGAMNAVNKAFSRIEKEFCEIASKAVPPMQDGSCAIIALVHYPTLEEKPDSIAVANLGDSRAVLFHDNKCVALSQEHSPARPDERERIEKAGGWVTIEKEMLIEKLHRMDLNDPMVRRKASRRFNYVQTSRVNGELAVSRALGDIDYKKPKQDNYKWFFPRTHEAYQKDKFTFSEDLVNTVPEWKIVDLGSIQDDESSDIEATSRKSFLVVACDGLWDTVTSEEACEIVVGCNSPQEASAALVNAAMRMGTSDNVTVLVINLNSKAFRS